MGDCVPEVSFDQLSANVFFAILKGMANSSFVVSLHVEVVVTDFVYTSTTGFKKNRGILNVFDKVASTVLFEEE